MTMVTIVFSPDVAALVSMAASSWAHRDSMIIRSSGLSGGTGFPFWIRQGCGFSGDFRHGAGSELISSGEIVQQLRKTENGGTDEALPRLRQAVIRNRRVFVVLPVVPGVVRRQQRRLPPSQGKALCIGRALVLQPQAQPVEHHERGHEAEIPGCCHRPEAATRQNRHRGDVNEGERQILALPLWF